VEVRQLERGVVRVAVRMWRAIHASVQRQRQELQGWTLLMSGYKENQAQAAQMCAERKRDMIESASTFAKPGDENSERLHIR
tara:strand:- start:1108 stop:1353 length:246 start_codon:yes stop_codon:yes gene_type:complete